MLFQISKFEILYRLRRPETYCYFVCLFLFSLVSVDFVFQGELGQLKPNSPYVIAFSMSVVSAIFMLVASMVSGLAILRDFEQNMESLLFVNPISKGDYFFGRFLGSFIVLLWIFLGLPLGMMLSEFLPWKTQEEMLAFNWWSYCLPFLFQVIPTLFFGSALFFVTGALSRKLLVVYTQGIFLFVAYLVGVVLTQETSNHLLASLLDPFSFRTAKLVTQYWSVTDRTNLQLSVSGLLLINRLFWIGLGFVALAIGYYGFSFNVVRGSGKSKSLSSKTTFYSLAYVSTDLPFLQAEYGWKQEISKFWSSTTFYFRSIVVERSFWAIVLCGAAIIFINSISLGVAYGVDSYPFSYLIVEDLQQTSIFFFLIILVFYSGELIWKERDVKADLVYDALPVADITSLAGKFFALMMTYTVLLLSLVLAGILFQVSRGWYDFDLKVYAVGFLLDMLTFLGLYTIIAFFFQVIFNQKYIAHLAVVMFFIGFRYLEVIGYDHALVKFGGPGPGTYSEMNGFGDYLKVSSWFNLYWMLFGLLVFILVSLFSVRGTETSLVKRWRMVKGRIARPIKTMVFFGLLSFALCGGYIFYNTNILNTYFSPAEETVYRADYETELKAFEYLPQPKIKSVDLKVELYPKDKGYAVKGTYLLANTSLNPIKEIHLQKRIDNQVELTKLDLEGRVEVDSTYDRFGYYIYKLEEPLLPGNQLELAFRQTYTTKGFTQSPDTRIVANGTFFTNDHLPTIGYDNDYELEDGNTRRDFGLPPFLKTALRNDPRELLNGRSGGDADEIDFAIVIGTDSSQTALAPGRLEREWMEGDRRYFQYRAEEPIINFYAIVSADYEVRKGEWRPKGDERNPVSLEIYHHAGHEYNLSRMEQAMEVSLDYYSKNFSPYQYDHLRIMEFPRYQAFAQSFPGTVPFSEAIGFVMDIDDAEEVDMAFFVTAHEVAHQWWGMQLVTANVQGRHMILESLSQYSAMMAMRQVYPEEKLRQFLSRELTIYKKGSANAAAPELPLALVDGRSYIHYSKGAINLYTFQECVSEDNVNLALRRFLEDWNIKSGKLKTDRYPTTEDLLGYFREVTPDSLQHLVRELFEEVELPEYYLTYN